MFILTDAHQTAENSVCVEKVFVLSNYCISIEYVSPQYVMFSAQTVEERRYLGPVFHGPYVPLRSESSESVSVREFHDTTDVSFIYL